MFLDLKLPLKSGVEVLQAIRSQPALVELSVVVLTSSAEARDILRTHELGAHSFLVKPSLSVNLAAAVTAACTRLDAPDVPPQKIPGDMFDVALPRRSGADLSAAGPAKMADPTEISG